MRILYVISSTQTGGAEKFLASLAKVIIQKWHQVRVICLKPLGPIAKLLQTQGAEVTQLPAGKLPGKQIRALRKEIEQFKPDLIHAMLFRAIEYTRLACAGKDIKLITTPHFDFSKRPFLYRVADCLLKEKDTLTIAESVSTGNYLIKKQHYRKDKVYILPNGVDKNRFYKDTSLRKAMRDKYGFHVKTTVFICVARLAEVKEPLLLLKAFRNVQMRNPDVKLMYVGEGEERAVLEGYTQRSNLSKDVVFVGEQDDINAFLNMADVFVLPSKEESLPLALLEALQVGLPCIVSRAGDMPLWVEHGKNGYVIPVGDLTLLSCFMSELSKPDIRDMMAKQTIKKSNQIINNFEKYSSLYQQVISNSFHVKTN